MGLLKRRCDFIWTVAWKPNYWSLTFGIIPTAWTVGIRWSHTPVRGAATGCWSVSFYLPVLYLTFYKNTFPKGYRP